MTAFWFVAYRWWMIEVRDPVKHFYRKS